MELPEAAQSAVEAMKIRSILPLVCILASATSQDDYDYADLGNAIIDYDVLFPPEIRNLRPTVTTTTARTRTPDNKKFAKELLPIVCGEGASARIIGGEEAGLGEYPWMVLLKYRNDKTGYKDFLCGGSIINEQYVLTAAHCLRVSGNTLIGVRLGEHDLTSNPDCDVERRCVPPSLDVGLERIIPHPQWSRRKAFHDIALLKLERPIKFSGTISPICLPRGWEADTKLEGSTAYVAGWGRTETGRKSNVKLKVAVPIIPTTTCKELFKSFTFDYTGVNQICAGGEHAKDSCSGDSGGPLMTMQRLGSDKRRAYLLGLVSFGSEKCGKIGEPAVYTRVSTYMSWILDTLRKELQK